MSSIAPVTERLISADSHVHFTDDWVKARLPNRLHAVWDEAVKKQSIFDATELRGGQKNLELEDFVDPEAARDPGHFEPHAKLAAMDSDGVEAEVIFPEVGGAKYCTPGLMGSDWKEALSGYNDGMADFASLDPKRLLTAYQLPLFDIDFAVQGSPSPREAWRALRADHALPERVRPAGRARRALRPACGARFGDLGITVLNHLDLKASLWDVFRRDPTPQKGIFTAMPAVALAETILFWILTGTLERFPEAESDPGRAGPRLAAVLLRDRARPAHAPALRVPGREAAAERVLQTADGRDLHVRARRARSGVHVLRPRLPVLVDRLPASGHLLAEFPQGRAEQFSKAGIPEADRTKDHQRQRTAHLRPVMS